MQLGLIWAAGAAAGRYETRSFSPEEGKINVHFVPHTHDDVGWLKTVDEYFAGQNNSIQHAGVNYILTTVARSLEADSNRTFTYAEQAFFQRWWDEQGEEVKAKMRQIVKDGQLEFFNGGWSMHDEACPHYMDMIDQTTLGHMYLKKEFNVTPVTGWQIDPFGHSATQAALLSAEVGFQGLFFGRIDYQDLKHRLDTRAAEFVWRPSESLGPRAQVFTGLTGEYGGNYGPPTGFCWDAVHCNDEPVQDDPNIFDMNVQSRVDQAVEFAKWQANLTRGAHIMFTMGSDYNYEDAEQWYQNIDRIIHYLNTDGRVNAFYSTPAFYVKEKSKEAVTWPLKTDDFFPYADGPYQFWSGFFTSYPALKRYVRELSGGLQAAKQATAFTSSKSASDPDAGLLPLMKALGLVQHHDAITGTSKQHVASDYAKRLAAGAAAAREHTAVAVARLAGASGDLSFCPLANVSVCGPMGPGNGGEVTVVVWNGLAQEREEILEVPLGFATGVKVTDLFTNKEVPSSTVPALPSITNYGASAGGYAHTALFRAKLPAVGYASFRIEAGAPGAEAAEAAGDEVVENEFLRLRFCAGTGALCEMVDLTSNTTIEVSQDLQYYRASVGNDKDHFDTDAVPTNDVEADELHKKRFMREAGTGVSAQASGAYIFRPNSSTPLRIADKPTLKVVRTEVATEVQQTFGSWASQRWRLAKGQKHVEVTYTVGAIRLEDGWGKEVISRYHTNIKNNGTSYTDSNGREMLKRQRDFRKYWKLEQTEPVAGNYYPLATGMHIGDEKAQLTVLVDAAQGGTGSIRNGEMEIMLHRRCLKDDSRGVSEPLNETQFITPYNQPGLPSGQHYGPGLVIRGTHYLLLTTPKEAAKAWRPLQDRVYVRPQLAFGSGVQVKAPSASFVSEALPANVQLLTLERLSETNLLVRLGHQFGVGEDDELSKPATVDLSKLFKGTVTAVKELSLTANQPRGDVDKKFIDWKVEDDPADIYTKAGDDAGSSITLTPLKIKTFVVSLTAVDTVFV